MRNKHINNRIIYIVFILAVTFLISIPLLIPGIEGRYGQDLGFHLNRIEGIAVELEAGHFPVRMQSFWMDGYGYPVSIYYGDILLYIPALLRMIGVPVVAAYKLFLVLINLLTVTIAAVCFGKMMNRTSIVFICTLVYVCASYRLENVYVRAAVGEVCAGAFLPLIIYGLYRIYKAPKQISDIEMLKNSIILMLGITGLINTHILSLEMVGITIIIVALVLFKKTFTKQVILTYLCALGLSFIVNMFFIVPFTDYYLTQDVFINRTAGGAKLIQDSGMTLSELFNFFKYPFANGIDAADERLLVTPGIASILIIILAIVLMITKKGNKEILLYTILSVVLLFVATCYFPWDVLADNTYVGAFLSQVQFPWRYIGIVVALTSVLLGRILEAISDKRIFAGIYIVICASCIVTLTWFTYEYATYGEFKYYETGEDLNSYDMGYIEYLRMDTSRESFTGNIDIEGTGNIELTEQRGVDRDYIVTDAAGGTNITLPIVNYRGYEIIDDSGNSIEISDGDNNLISFTLSSDYTGNLYLRYKQAKDWKYAIIISLFAVLALIIILIAINRKNVTEEQQ